MLQFRQVFHWYWYIRLLFWFTNMCVNGTFVLNRSLVIIEADKDRNHLCIYLANTSSHHSQTGTKSLTFSGDILRYIFFRLKGSHLAKSVVVQISKYQYISWWNGILVVKQLNKTHFLQTTWAVGTISRLLITRTEFVEETKRYFSIFTKRLSWRSREVSKPRASN